MQRGGAVTVRAIALGLAAATALCALAFFNDLVLRNTYLVGNYMPVAVYGGLVLFMMAVNPLLHRIRERLALSGRELAVAVALGLFACCVPGRGFMHYFTYALMMPHHLARAKPGWQAGPAALAQDDVRDWPGLAAALAGADGAFGEGGRREAWDALPPELREDLRRAAAGGGEWTAAPRAALLDALNALIDEPHADSGVETDENRAKRRRDRLDALFPGLIEPRRQGILEHVPARLLADPTVDHGKALEGFVAGLGVGDRPISVREVPWRAWTSALRVWLPLMFSVYVALIGLSLVLHRQWSVHEHLPYPLAEFSCALLPEKGAAQGSVFRDRIFWLGAGIVLAIHLNNYAAKWWPDHLIPIRLFFDLLPIARLFPAFQASTPYGVFTIWIFFTVIGFSYFLAGDVSLSFGLAPVVYSVVVGILAAHGVTMGGGQYLSLQTESFAHAGAFVGMFLVLAYTGRHYYLKVLRGSLRVRGASAVERYAVWGARAFLAGSVLFVLQLAALGVEWPFAALYALGVVMLFTVISRLLAEAGVFFLFAYFYPCVLMWGFLGGKVLGPDQLLRLGLVSTVLLLDPRDALMPFVVTGLKIVDRMGERVGRTAAWGTVALGLGLAVAIPTTLYLQYRHGAAQAGDEWVCGRVPSFAIDANVKLRQTLQAQGVLEEVVGRTGLARFADMNPYVPGLVAFSITLGLVLLFSACRLRFARWPFHPLMFCVLGTWATRHLAGSFLIGWLIKSAVLKYGGGGLYQRLKPFMIGLIAGEALGAVVPLVVGGLYHLATGEPPVGYRVLPT